MDLQSIRLLLDFKADPNILCKNRSLLTFAAKSGNFKALKLLLDAKADLHLGDPTPLEVVARCGSRECLAALLDGHENDLLTPIKGKLPIEIALEEKTTLLSVIAVYTKRQFDEAKEKGESVPVFPPKTLKRSRLKKLNAALKQNDYLLPFDIVRKSVLQVKSPWKKEKDSDVDSEEENEIVESLNTTMNTTRQSKKVLSNEDMIVPPTPFKYNNNELPESDEDDVSYSMTNTTASTARKPAFFGGNDSDDISADIQIHLETPASKAIKAKNPFS